MPDDIHLMLSKCLQELDDIVTRLQNVADLLIEVRNDRNGVGDWRRDRRG